MRIIPESRWGAVLDTRARWNSGVPEDATGRHFDERFKCIFWAKKSFEFFVGKISGYLDFNGHFESLEYLRSMDGTWRLSDDRFGSYADRWFPGVSINVKGLERCVGFSDWWMQTLQGSWSRLTSRKKVAKISYEKITSTVNVFGLTL